MILKEKEAHQKICPIALNGGIETKCISNECMAWEWYNEYEGYCGLVPGDIEFINRTKPQKNA